MTITYGPRASATRSWINISSRSWSQFVGVLPMQRAIFSTIHTITRVSLKETKSESKTPEWKVSAISQLYYLQKLISCTGILEYEIFVKCNAVDDNLQNNEVTDIPPVRNDSLSLLRKDGTLTCHDFQSILLLSACHQNRSRLVFASIFAICNSSCLAILASHISNGSLYLYHYNFCGPYSHCVFLYQKSAVNHNFLGRDAHYLKNAFPCFLVVWYFNVIKFR